MSDVIREIAHLIENQSGFVIGEQSLRPLDQFVQQRLQRGGFAGLERYADYLRRHPDSAEWRHILSKITIKESYLFRGNAQFEAMTDVVLEEIAERRQDRRLRVWCAGCARGEEAATLAIVLAGHPIVGSWSWRVLATDVDESALADARKGLYGERAVARVPKAALTRHFLRRGDDRYELDGQLRDHIEYRRINLIDQPLQLDGEKFDLIFLRNVLIYFRPELQRRVVESVEEVLESDGTLFLGPSESLIHLGTSLRARDLGDCFCYRRTGQESPRSSAAGSVTQPQLPEVDPVALPRTTEEEQPEIPFAVRLESAVTALEAEEHSRALAGLESLRHEDPESAVVHALEGIALERTGQPDRSVLAYRAALYLAPDMDEVRFLLARALEGLGRTRAAEREYRTALSGLGPSSNLSAEFSRIGLPDHEGMSRHCLVKILNK